MAQQTDKPKDASPAAPAESSPELLVRALAEAGCEARTHAMASFAEEVSRRTGLQEPQPLAAACAKVIASLEKKASKHHEKFKDLVCNYLLKVPRTSFGEHLALRPCELIEPLAKLDKDDGEEMEMDVDAARDGERDKEQRGGSGDEEQTNRSQTEDHEHDGNMSGNLSDSRLAAGEARGRSRGPSDSDLAGVFQAVGEAICQGQQLQEEALTLQKRLDLLRSMAEMLRGSSESQSSGDTSAAVAISKKLAALMQMLGEQSSSSAAAAATAASKRGSEEDSSLGLKRASPWESYLQGQGQAGSWPQEPSVAGAGGGAGAGAGGGAASDDMEVEPRESPKRLRSNFGNFGARPPFQSQREPAGFGLLRREPQQLLQQQQAQQQQQHQPSSSGFGFQGEGRQLFRSQAPCR